MDDDPGDGAPDDERALELSTIAAIYPELVPGSWKGPFSASIDISIEPNIPLPICFPSADGNPAGLPTPPDSLEAGVKPDSENCKENLLQDVHHLSHLPPLSLRIALPNGYPSNLAPEVQLETQLSWLPRAIVEDLAAASHGTWEEMGRDQSVFSYIDYLRDAAEKGFDLVHGEGAVLEVSADLKVALLDFDLKAKRAKFEQETFECGICLEPKKGSVCHRLLLCSHVFCVSCLQDFYTSSITEGDIINVKCMDPDCGKDPDDSLLEPSELLQIPLNQETVQRYIKLVRKKRLESDRTTIYCPRQWCQGPSRCPNKKAGREKKSSAEAPAEPQEYDRNVDEKLLPPPAERLAICEDCTFAFCKVCKASWHGEFFVCFPRSEFELSKEERASEDYMKYHTQPCPTCDARAQKTHGCNHMICFKCNTHFCYLCGSYLDKGNPYVHYNTETNGCYMRLWELEAGDDGEFGQGFAGGVGRIDDLDNDTDSDDDEAAEEIDMRPPPPALRPAAAAAAPAQRGQPGAGPDNNGPGIQRFLQLVQNDEEDEWDSDEMSDEEGDFHILVD